MISFRSINRQIVLGTFVLTWHSFYMLSTVVAAAGSESENSALTDNDSKLAFGSHQAELKDVSLHYAVSGHGPLVVVTSPGWGIGSLYLQRGLAPLEKKFTVLYLDTRGSGGSPRPTDPKQMSTATMADDIDRLRSYLGLESINLMGHSNGGTIALDYAERYPQRAKKVVLIDAEVLDDRDETATQRYLTLWAGDPRFKHAVEAALSDPPDNTDEQFETNLKQILPLYFSDPTRYLAIFEQQVAGTHLSAFTEKAQGDADKLAPRYQSREYAKVQAKTLIISGTIDWVCPVEVSERAHNAIAGSTLSLYANVGHLPYIEEPDRFFSEVAQFLAD
jgi:pimeloyl-ACP methyl ester carboxylesterase